MNAIWMRHPTEETLSRLADDSQIDRRRSRAGRHAEHCASCKSTIDGFIALGAAARSMPDTAPPTALWGRIVAGESVAHAARTDSVLASIRPPDLRTEETRHRPSLAGRVAFGIAAAAVIIVVATLVWPTRQSQSLRAASPERLIVSPEYPLRGSTVRIRYVPAAAALTADSIWAIITIASDTAVQRWSVFGEDGIAVPLRRDGAGDYRGTYELPTDAVAGVVEVPRARRRSLLPMQEVRQLILLATQPGGRPSLEAMERASDLPLGSARQQLVSAFVNFSPDHPLRFALVDDPVPAGSMLARVRRFTMRERTLGRLDTKLRARTTHRVYELVGMIGLAYSLEEPETARYWSDVLVAEHPEDTHALGARVDALHQMELAGAPRDSIARLLPSLDTLYRLSRGAMLQPWAISALVRNSGDSADVRRWRLREIRRGAFIGYRRGAYEAMRDPEVADSASAWAREVLDPPRPVASLPQKLRRTRAYATLADAAYWQGDPVRALMLSDSARLIAGECGKMATFGRVAALLAIGDTSRAQDALAERWWWPDASPDSARALLGRRFDPVRWSASVAAAEQRDRACTGRSP